MTNTTPDTQTRDLEIGENVANANTLDELRDLLNDAQGELDRDERKLGDVVDTTALPVFGGAEPEDTHGIFSWDADRLLVQGDPMESRPWKIVPRDEE